MIELLLDAGHGGHDPGATVIGPPRLLEKDVTLDVVLKMREVAQELHPEWVVSLTREDDTYLSPSARRIMCEDQEPTAFISIHCNAASSYKANGFEVLYRKGKDQELAESLKTVVLASFALRDRGLKHDIRDLGRKLAVLSPQASATALVELGFLTNAGDRLLMRDTLGMASCLISGVERWVESFGG